MLALNGPSADWDTSAVSKAASLYFTCTMHIALTCLAAAATIEQCTLSAQHHFACHLLNSPAVAGLLLLHLCCQGQGHALLTGSTSAVHLMKGR